MEFWKPQPPRSTPLSQITSPTPRTITKAQFITEQVSLLADMFLVSNVKKADLNYSAYIVALSPIPTDVLRIAFSKAPHGGRKFMPLPVELIELAAWRPVEDKKERTGATITTKNEPLLDVAGWCLCGFTGIPHRRFAEPECVWTKYGKQPSAAVGLPPDAIQA
jgi:hypothetical protein